MRKFDIQDRVILDEMVDNFVIEMHKNQDEADLIGRRPIITREYWLQMIKVVQDKIDSLTTQKALRNSNQYRNK
tara:strand:- start:104 stop:325 length:222 start_codon:yes stop_codon:yes gene_type:complete